MKKIMLEGEKVYFNYEQCLLDISASSEATPALLSLLAKWEEPEDEEDTEYPVWILVRRNVASNPNTSLDVLRVLMSDRDWYTAELASNTLAIRLNKN